MLSKTKSGGFFEKNILFVFLVAFFCVKGANSNVFLSLAVITIVIAMIFSSYEHRFCWALFLVPNIRLFDSIGTTSVVNVLFVIPLVFYFFRAKSKISFFPIFCGFLMFLVEFIHRIINNESFFDLFGWVLAFVWCVYAILDEDIQIKKDDATYALILGIIFSGVVFLINNPYMLNGLVPRVLRGERFEAYANDPNYFSTYICIAFSALVIKSKIKAVDYFFMIVLLLFGLLTTSKMCIILIVVDIVYFILSTINDSSKAIRNLVIICAFCLIVYEIRDFLGLFIERLFDRAGGTNITLDSLTSQRSTIVADYFGILSNDILTLLFGRGFAYHTILETTRGQQAHNTYLDIILTWGISGTWLFLYIIREWYKKFKEKLNAVKFTRSSMLPFITLLLSFFSLSSFKAGMFFFVISFCMIQLESIKFDDRT